MKLIAVEMTWIFLIGITSLIIAVSVLIFWREKIIDFFFCNIYGKMFPLQYIDEKCSREENIETVEIFSNDEKEIINLFSSYLLKCWLDAEKYKNFKTHYCYKILFKTNIEFKITPQNISKSLKMYDDCKSLQYKSYTCGFRDDILWSVEKNYISREDIVIIKYLDTHLIEIIA